MNSGIQKLIIETLAEKQSVSYTEAESSYFMSLIEAEVKNLRQHTRGENAWTRQSSS